MTRIESFHLRHEKIALPQLNHQVPYLIMSIKRLHFEHHFELSYHLPQ